MFPSNPRPSCGNLEPGCGNLEPGCGNLGRPNPAKCGNLTRSEGASRAFRDTFEVQPGARPKGEKASWQPRKAENWPFVVTLPPVVVTLKSTLSPLFTSPWLLVVCGNLISRSIKKRERGKHATTTAGYVWCGVVAKFQNKVTTLPRYHTGGYL